MNISYRMSIGSVRLWLYFIVSCHCEERSDKSIFISDYMGLLRPSVEGLAMTRGSQQMQIKPERYYS